MFIHTDMYVYVHIFLHIHSWVYWKLKAIIAGPGWALCRATCSLGRGTLELLGENGAVFPQVAENDLGK